MEVHSHVPYVIILLQALKIWKDSHDGQKPKSFAEKDEFKKFIKEKMAMKYYEENNFIEAVNNSYKLF